MIKDKKGNPIVALKDWPGAYRMKAGRSAQELATHWLSTTGIPEDVQVLLEKRWGSVTFTEGRPELNTPLPPKGSNGGRMHDLWYTIQTDEGPVTVCVEAKADEPFDVTISEYKKKAKVALTKHPKSRAKARLGDLQSMVWSSLPVNVGALRYQLLSALTGTAIQTSKDQSRFGLLLIHTFNTAATTSLKRWQNDKELDLFLDSLSLRSDSKKYTTRSGCFCGAVDIIVPPEFSHSGMSETVVVYIAKLCTYVP